MCRLKTNSSTRSSRTSSEAALLEQKVRAEDLQKENAQLKRENNQLKRMPLFVAVIVDILENNEIYLRQQGNNQRVHHPRIR